MTRVDKTIEVNVPLETAYNQWTQFGDFPQFMEGIEEVKQLDVARAHWTANIGGQHREWTTRVMRQIPDKVLAWHSEDNVGADGIVVFQPLSEDRTQVKVRMACPTDGDADASLQVEGDLQRFKDFIESRGYETGAWRGEIIAGNERLVTPLQDSADAPEADQIRFGVSPLDSNASSKPEAQQKLGT